MACVHLRQLYKLCQEHDLKLSGTDLIRVVCHQCGEQEVCPSTLIESDEFDSQQPIIESKEKRSKDSAN